MLLAQNQQQQAKQGYLSAIAAYWQAYYQLRVTTMYDIEKQEDIYKQELLTVARWMLQLFAATKTALY